MLVVAKGTIEYFPSLGRLIYLILKSSQYMTINLSSCISIAPHLPSVKPLYNIVSIFEDYAVTFGHQQPSLLVAV
jgi:hypothetical protein